MEQKADYAELRRLYFGPREQDKTPSHSDVSSFESNLDESLETPTTRLREVINSAQETDEVFSSICQDEVSEFKTQLSQRSNDIINNLYDKYGTRTYSKITQMIKSEDFSEWEQLEQELLSIPAEPILNESEEMIYPSNDNLSFNFSDSFEELTLDADADLDYLDALVQHDYGRLRKLQSDSECISSIFSEILENEQNSNTNYQDEVFNKNIELIFNPNVNLDECCLDSSDEEAFEIPTVPNLNDAIDQLKQTQVVLEEKETVDLQAKQASLDAFFADQRKVELQQAQEKEEVNETYVLDKKRRRVGFNLNLLLIALIALVLCVYIVLQLN